MDFANLNLSQGQQIAIVSQNRTFFGTFNQLCCTTGCLELVQVKNEAGKQIARFKIFFQSNVTRILELEGSESGVCMDESLKDSQLTIDQTEAINQYIENRVYINKVDATYHEAINAIASNFIIGLSAPGCLGRTTHLSILSISTADKIYIFDILVLSQIMKDLGPILSSDNYLKVMHDGQKLVDNLSVIFKVNLDPLFDIMLAATKFYNKKDVMEVKNCIKTIAGQTVTVPDGSLLLQRPFSEKILKDIATETAYMLPMYYLLQQDSEND